MRSIFEFVAQYGNHANLVLIAAYLLSAWRARRPRGQRSGAADVEATAGAPPERRGPTPVELAAWVLATNGRTVRATILMLALALLAVAADPSVLAAIVEAIT